MKCTILGSGTSGGIPMIGCRCAVCSSLDPRDKRLRSSVLISTGTAHIAIDAGPDFRMQMLHSGTYDLQAIVFTHGHRDHTAGLDDIRAFNFFQRKPMDVYATKETESSLRQEYSYAFSDVWYPGLPEVEFHTIDNAPFEVAGLRLQPIAGMHYKMEVFGYRMGDLVYMTDCNFITEEEKQKMRNARTLVINALRKEKHISHFSLEEALELIEELKPEKAYLTHLSHQMGKHADVEHELPPGVHLAFDGLELEFSA